MVNVCRAALAVAVYVALCAGGRADAVGDGVPTTPNVGEVLELYNAEISRAVSAVGSLWVQQTMLEPQDDGSVKSAEATLSYEAGGEMVRDILRSELSHMYGSYTLQSLVGPRIEGSEYEVVQEGVEEKEGHACYRLLLRALVRDADHFDGIIWISREHPGPVRITGAVADPPFPVTEIRLDKAFELMPCGLWMVRRHTGEVEVSLFGRRRGVRHIFYDGYDIRLAAAQRQTDAE
jgi:hypothetical protein